MRTSHDVLSFINTAAVFRNFIPKFADIAAPLYELTQVARGPITSKKRGAYKRALQGEDISTRWNEKHDLAVGLLKKALTSWPVLVGPRYDGTPFYISTDASSAGIGCHLWQYDTENRKRSVAYLSRQTTPVEKKAHSSALELAAVKYGLDKCGKYTTGWPVIVQTDCQAVRDLLRSESSAGPRSAWKEAICSSGIIDFEHVPGVSNVVADALSRNAVSEAEETHPDWGQRIGVTTSPYDIKVRALTADAEVSILDRFSGDDIEDVLRWVTQRDTDMIEKGVLEETKKRSQRYWIDEPDTVRYRVPGFGVVTVLPESEGEAMAMREHEAGGHIGRDLLQARLLNGWIWPRMRKHVDKVLHDCKRCVQFGTTLQRLLLKPVFEFSPFSRVAMDYLSMPVGKGGVDNVLVAVDIFSRFCMAWAYKGNGTAEKTIRSLNDMQRTYVRPRALLLDNDRAFDNEAVREWCAGTTEIEMSAPYEHVGIAENMNHLILERLRRLANLDIDHVPTVLKPPYPKNWPDVLQQSVAALNDRRLHYLGNLTPREVLLGVVRADGEQEPTVSQRLMLLEATRLDATRAFQQEQKNRVDKSKPWNEYVPREGHLVLVYDATEDRTYATGSKLRPKWQGPWRVREIKGRRSVVLETLEGLPRRGRVGFRRLKRWGMPPQTDEEC
ncbi:hypothetical protein FFLO_07125 [Filobasidium floriforme]|uniref:Integrase catalytic domain-containing protein n=1 Tax=Filobasidium floriforme TaxID=5210 RepID=A0A8K0JDL1_9TREE|nr:hypothetical protein FFLO_07125 [Filobasidium floriforme]